MTDYGLRVAAPGGRLQSGNFLLDSTKENFRYSKIEFIPVEIPGIGANSSDSAPFNYSHGLPGTPLFSTVVQDYEGKWRDSAKGNVGSSINGYFLYDSINREKYSGRLYVLTFGGSAVPAHTAWLRVKLFWNEV